VLLRQYRFIKVQVYCNRKQ